MSSNLDFNLRSTEIYQSFGKHFNRVLYLKHMMQCENRIRIVNRYWRQTEARLYAFAIIEKNDDGGLAEAVGIKGGGNWAVSADILDRGKTGLIAN